MLPASGTISGDQLLRVTAPGCRELGPAFVNENDKFNLRHEFNRHARKFCIASPPGAAPRESIDFFFFLDKSLPLTDTAR